MAITGGNEDSDMICTGPDAADKTSIGMVTTENHDSTDQRVFEAGHNFAGQFHGARGDKDHCENCCGYVEGGVFSKIREHAARLQHVTKNRALETPLWYTKLLLRDIEPHLRAEVAGQQKTLAESRRQFRKLKGNWDIINDVISEGEKEHTEMFKEMSKATTTEANILHDQYSGRLTYLRKVQDEMRDMNEHAMEQFAD